MENHRELTKTNKPEQLQKNSIDFDDVLEELGELGRFQIFTYILVCLPVFFAGANSLSYVFTAGVPKYRFEIFYQALLTFNVNLCLADKNVARQNA